MGGAKTISACCLLKHDFLIGEYAMGTVQPETTDGLGKLVLQQSDLVKTENSYVYRDLNKNGKLDIYEDSRQPIEARVENLLRQMTPAEKAGTLFINGSVINSDGSIEDKPGAPGFGGVASTQMMDQKMNHFNLWEIPAPQVVAIWHNNLQRFAEQTRLGIPVTIASDPRNHFSQNVFAMVANGFSQWCEPLKPHSPPRPLPSCPTTASQ